MRKASTPNENPKKQRESTKTATQDFDYTTEGHYEFFFSWIYDMTMHCVSFSIPFDAQHVLCY